MDKKTHVYRYIETSAHVRSLVRAAEVVRKAGAEQKKMAKTLGSHAVKDAVLGTGMGRVAFCSDNPPLFRKIQQANNFLELFLPLL